MTFLERFIKHFKYKWEPRPKLPRSERVSVLDEIIHSDWYQPRKKHDQRHDQKHTAEQHPQ